MSGLETRYMCKSKVKPIIILTSCSCDEKQITVNSDLQLYIYIILLLHQFALHLICDINSLMIPNG